MVRDKHRCIACSEPSAWFISKDNDATGLLCSLRSYALEPENRLPDVQHEPGQTEQQSTFCRERTMLDVAMDCTERNQARLGNTTHIPAGPELKTCFWGNC